MSHRDDPRGGEEPPVVVRDRRRIDPTTGAVRTPDPSSAPAGDGAFQPTRPEDAAGGVGTGTAAAGGTAGGSDVGDELRAQLDERTQDLQRVTAEYANYRKRVERDREAVVTYAKAQVVGDLLGVLDDLERAEAHGDLTGPFKAVAEKVNAALQKAGLRSYGHEGEVFDPSQHEAVQHSTSPDVSGPTVTAVLRRGYTFGERVLRPAMVAVTDHEPAEPGAPAAAAAPAASAASEGRHAAPDNGRADGEVRTEPESPRHDGDGNAATNG